MIKFYITRHGLTLWNVEGRLQGRKDSPLQKQGIDDALALKKHLSGIEFSEVYSSPIKRAYDTASLIFDEVKCDDRLMEMSFGDYEGKKVASLKEDPLYINLWQYPDKFTRFNDGESYQEVKDRLESFLNEMIATKDGNIFICIHGMALTVLLSIFYNEPIKNLTKFNQNILRGGSITVVSYDGQYHVEVLGDDSFLEGKNANISYK